MLVRQPPPKKKKKMVVTLSHPWSRKVTQPQGPSMLMDIWWRIPPPENAEIEPGVVEIKRRLGGNQKLVELQSLHPVWDW